MTKDEVILYVINKGLIKKVGENKYVVVSPKDSGTLTVSCKNLPSKYKGISLEQAMKYFFDDAKIPAFSTGEMSYALRTMNKKSIKIFSEILSDNSIDFSILVAKTSNYYSSSKTVKPSISTYFAGGLWSTVYQSYEEDNVNSENSWL